MTDSPSMRDMQPSTPLDYHTGAAFDELVRAACIEAASDHERLCPRQVLGVRLGLAGARALDVPVPAIDKRLLIFAETDGCFVDGVGAATGCTVGHRTLRMVDYGRVAITAVDTRSSRAVRVAPRTDVRELVARAVPDEPRQYQAQLAGYQSLADSVLLTIQPVEIALDLDALLGERGVRMSCVRCGEEVLNRREVATPEGPQCLGCHAPAYYRSTPGR